MDAVRAATLDLAQVESLLREAVAKKALVESDIVILSRRRSELAATFKIGDIVENINNGKVIGTHKILHIRPSEKGEPSYFARNINKDGSESKVLPSNIWVRMGGHLRLASDHSLTTKPKGY